MLRLKTLGGLTIQSDGGAPAGAATQRRRLALLALLARAGEGGMSRDKIIGYLWPDSEPEKARGGLAQALYSVRRDLGADDLFLGTADLRLNPAVLTSDVSDFCAAVAGGRLEQAAALYGGPFLDGIYVGEAAEFERWMETERAELARTYAGTLERLARAADSSGDHPGAVSWWRKLAGVDPFNSRVALGLMQSLADSGDRAGAIQHARVYATLLRQELEVDPDPEISRLADRLRQETISSPRPGQRVGPAPSVPPLNPQAPSPQPAEPARPTVQPELSTPVARLGSARRYRAGLTGLLVAAFGLAALAWYFHKRPASDAGTRRMVAVLPFQNLGPATDEYFADGLTEEVTARLAGLSGLGVISRTSSMQYKKTTKSLKQIAQELGVAYVLEGSVRWERLGDGGSRIRVTPQLIQVSDDSHLWATEYDADLADVFRVQGDIAERVASALDIALRAPEREALASRPTKSPEAYDEYLRGNLDLDRAWGDEKSLRSALASYERAVQRDSSFAPALAKLSIAHTMMFRLGFDDDEARLDQAKAAVDAAFRAEPRLVDGHLALGYYYYWGLRDYPRARREFLLVRKSRPRDPEMLSGLAAVERRQGDWANAVRDFREAAELDPRSSNKAWECGLAHYFTRDYPAAERYLNRAISLAPAWAYPYTTKARLYLSWTGDVERARGVLRDAFGKTDISSLITGVNDVGFLLTRDTALRVRLSRLTLKEFDSDTLYYHMWKGLWYRDQKDAPRERAAWDSMRTAAESDLRVRQKYEISHPAQAEQAYITLAIANAGLGRKEEALQAAEKALQLVPLSKDPAWGADRGVYLAQIYLRLGETDRAIQQLEQLLSIPSPLSPVRLQVDPTWDPLRSNPLFQRLLRQSPQKQPS